MFSKILIVLQSVNNKRGLDIVNARGTLDDILNRKVFLFEIWSSFVEGIVETVLQNNFLLGGRDMPAYEPQNTLQNLDPANEVAGPNVNEVAVGEEIVFRVI